MATKIQYKNFIEPADQKQQVKDNSERTLTQPGAASSGLPAYDTIGSAGPAASGEDSDLVYVSPFKRAAQGIGKFLGAALQILRGSESEESDEEEPLDITTKAPPSEKKSEK